GEEHEDVYEKNLLRLAAPDVALLVLSLLVTSCGIYAVVEPDTISASPGVTYATFVIGITAALASFIRGITRKKVLAYLMSPWSLIDFSI
ncbi:unnamed protein product, partial [Hymenolepis diminuta]